MNKCRLVRCSVWCACAFETKCGYGFHIGHFDRNEISFRVIEYHVNTTRNEMLIVHQIIGSFWNAAEMKLHVNKICFHADLKSQTCMSSFRLSCERTLILHTSLTFDLHIKAVRSIVSKFIGQLRKLKDRLQRSSYYNL